MANENCIISIRNRKSHDVRFYNILIALSDVYVDWKFFRETLNFLCVPELEEIVEERISTNKCGYVLCNNLINIHPTAMFSLDISKRKIYNLSNRKKYCSNWCYGAFKHICDQIPWEPLWKNKDKITNKVFSLYPSTENGCGGELYFDEDLYTDENSESDKIAKNDYHETQQKCNPKKIIQNISPQQLANKPNDMTENPKRQETMKNVINSLDKLAINKKKTLEEVVNKIKTKAVNNQNRKLKIINEHLNDSDMILIPSDEESLFVLEKIKFLISSWITEETQDFICDSPNYDLDEDLDNQDGTDDKPINNEECELLPTLDSEDEMTIRRNILIKKAKMACVPILGDFNIEPNNFLKEFEKLIYTCRLTAKNIIFSNKEFKWLIIVFVDLLSSKLGKVDDDRKASVLKKHGITQSHLYEKVLEDIYSYIDQPVNISLSPQGDSIECK